MAGPNVRTILIDKNNRVWLGTKNGLSQFYEESNHKWFENYRYQSGKNSLSNNMVMSLWEGKKDKIWIGTNGGGINKLDLKTGQFSAYTNA
ncbi:MAG: two-component regulator propeller domain-containing protein, partial [Pseudomonadota bacterium]